MYDTDEILNTPPTLLLIAERMDTVVDLVIDGGYGGNIASTVISLVDGHPLVLRQGAGPADEFLINKVARAKREKNEKKIAEKDTV